MRSASLVAASKYPAIQYSFDSISVIIRSNSSSNEVKCSTNGSDKRIKTWADALAIVKVNADQDLRPWKTARWRSVDSSTLRKGACLHHSLGLAGTMACRAAVLKERPKRGVRL